MSHKWEGKKNSKQTDGIDMQGNTTYKGRLKKKPDTKRRLKLKFTTTGDHA